MNWREAILGSCALVLGGLIWAGCATQSGYQQADRTGNRIGAFRDQVVSMRVAVGEVTEALSGVVDAPPGDPRRAYRRFSRSIDRLEATDAKGTRRADRMRAEGREFFSAWEQEAQSIQNEDLRMAAQERRAALDREFRDISRVIVELRDVYRPWLKDVQDLRTWLGRDLTGSGVDRARGLIGTVQEESVGVERALDNLISQLELVEAKLRPGGR